MLVVFILQNGFGQNCFIYLREDEDVRKACYSWVEHCDWIPFFLTGGRYASQMKTRCLRCRP